MLIYFLIVQLSLEFAPNAPLRRRITRRAAELDDLLDAACDAAKVAGTLMVEAGPEARKSTTKATAKDLLTKTDVACQQAIEQELLARWPEARLLGEENVAPGAEASAIAAKEMLSDSSLCWVVDPIDGTANFVDGIPLSSVSIAAVVDNEPIVGVVYDPYRDELFAAAKGRGATLNGATILASPVTDLSDAIIYAGAPPTARSLAPSLRGINAVAPKIRTLRLLGSAALMLAYVAAGRGCAYFEADLSAWDTSAGACLITEAGGTVTDADGSLYRPATTRQIVATNNHIHADLLSLLDSVDGARILDSDGS